jgi:hypothetical protein
VLTERGEKRTVGAKNLQNALESVVREKQRCKERQAGRSWWPELFHTHLHVVHAEVRDKHVTADSGSRV